jgi:hypothetical protein
MRTATLRAAGAALCAITIALCVLWMSGCVHVGGGSGGTFFMSTQGSGVAKTEQRDLKEFRRVELEGSARVRITIGQPQQVTVTGDDNIVPLIGTIVDGDTLRIAPKEGSYSAKTQLEVTITVASLTGFDLRGSGDVRIDGLNEPEFAVDIRGSGDLTAHGKADTVRATIRGSGNVDLTGVTAKTADASINGSGDVRVNASESVKASVRGSGDIQYKGDPPQVDKQITGSGNIRKM